VNPIAPSVSDCTPSYCLIPGAGSAGLTWTDVRGRLNATVLPVPDEPDVRAMAAVLQPRVDELPRPRVLVGASLGAMVALELSRDVPVDALVLIAAGFGIEVGESVLGWVAAAPPDLLAKIAKLSLADRDDEEAIEVARNDLESRGHPVLLRHLRALADHQPEPVADPPPTLVIWGDRDRSVPLRDHVELAQGCGGVLVPVADAGHLPFFEQPEVVAGWIEIAARLCPRSRRDQMNHPGNRDLPDLP